MRLLFFASILLCVGVIKDITARRSRTRRELAPGLHTLGIRDPGGSYCQKRTSCCPGRDDACTVPYLDTICYCDLFCNRTVSDCCPDFWGFCLHISPPVNIQKGMSNNTMFTIRGLMAVQTDCSLCMSIFPSLSLVHTSRMSGGIRPMYTAPGLTEASCKASFC